MATVNVHFSTQELELAEKILSRLALVDKFKAQGNSASARRSFIRHYLQSSGEPTTRQVERLSRAVAAALGLPEGEHLNPRSQDLTREKIPPLILNTEGKNMPYTGSKPHLSNIRLKGLTEQQCHAVKDMVIKHEADSSITVSNGDYCEVFVSGVKGPELSEQLLQYAKTFNLRHEATFQQAEQYAAWPSLRLENNTPNLQQVPKKGNTMSTTPIAITNKTLINGQDAANFSDAELYELIRREEVKIEELDKIKNKPKKLLAEIDKRKAGIKSLVEFMDSRDEKSAS